MWRHGSAGSFNTDSQETTLVNVRANAASCHVYAYVRFEIPTDSADADIVRRFAAEVGKLPDCLESALAQMRADPATLGIPGTG